MSEWEETTLGAISDKVDGTIRTGPFGSHLHQSDYVESGTPVVMPKNIEDGSISTDDIAYINDEDLERLSQYQLHIGDIVYGRRGDIGRQALITPRENGWLCGTGCLRISLGDRVINPVFLHYYLKNPEIIDWIYNQAVGATMPNLNTKILRSVPVQVPPIEEQRKIAAVLSKYDDLIEANQREIDDLEKAAQSLYREWFVEFRFPGHEAVPMVATDEGYVPQGWRWVQLSDVVTVNAENISSSDEPEFINYINISSVDKGQINEIERMPYDDAPGRAKRVVHHGDTIWSGVRPNLKAYALIVWPGENWIASTGFAVLTPRKIPFTYLYYSVITEQFVTYLINHATGAAYPSVNVSEFKSAPLLLPPDNLMEQFHDVIEDMVLKSANLREQNNELRDARDKLLPKLVSGAVRVDSLDVW